MDPVIIDKYDVIYNQSVENLITTTLKNINIIQNFSSNRTVGGHTQLPSVNVLEDESPGTTDKDDVTALNITDILGSQRDSLLIVIPITIIYTLIFISGVIGNISTCIVIRKNRSMHTATNFYLFSLAISDFMLLLSGVPQEMYFIWSKYPYVFGEAFCVGRGLAAETSANATVLTITAFTAERYVAICHPFMSHAMSKLNRVTRIIFLIWMASFLTAIPQAAQFGLHDEQGIILCIVVRRIVEHSFELSTFIFFFTPMSIILVLYLLIGLKLRQANLLRPTNNENYLHRNTNSLRSQSYQGTKRVIKMLVAVVLGFFICWAPFHAQRLIAIYGAGVNQDNQKNPTMVTLNTVMTYISGVLYYVSTCINPILYNLMSNKFREAFKETLEQCNIFSTKKTKPQREYRVLSRTKRLRVAFQESADYTSSSQREESFQSSASSWKFNNESSLMMNSDFVVGQRQRSMTSKMSYSFDTPTRKRQSFADTKSDHDSLGNDSIIEIDEVDLPTTDASLNVVYTKQGDIHIRLQKKKICQSTRTRGAIGGRFISFVSRIIRPKPKHMGFYTPPIADNGSIFGMNLPKDVLKSPNEGNHHKDFGSLR